MKVKTALLLLISPLLITAQKEWKLKKDSDSVKVYTKDSESGFKSFRGVTLIDAPISNIVNLIWDVNSVKTYTESAKEVFLIDSTGSNKKVQYTETKLPFPFDNRDIVMDIEFMKDTITSGYLLSMNSNPKAYPDQDGIIRIQNIQGYYRFEIMANSQIQLTYEMNVDPAGSLPAWLVNMKVIDEPFKTLLALRNLCKEQRYNKPCPQIDFLELN